MSSVDHKRLDYQSSQAHRPVRVPKTAELVASQLRERVIRGKLPEGTKLMPQAQLTKEFGISRPTLREALRILEVEGLVSIDRGAHGGARVHQPGTSVIAKNAGLYLQSHGTTIGEIEQARLLIEPAAARIVAERQSAQAIKLLKMWVKRERELLDKPREFIYLVGEFSRILLEQTNNRALVLIYEMIYQVSRASMRALVGGESASKYDVKMAELGLRQCEKLVRLIEVGAGAEAEVFWRRHLEAVSQMLFKDLNKKTVVDVLSRA